MAGAVPRDRIEEGNVRCRVTNRVRVRMKTV